MLEIKNLSCEIENKKILNNIDLSFGDNQLVAITGHNGSGKTTLSKVIMGITKSCGQIFYNGQDISNLDISQRAKMGFSYAFQQPIKFKGISVQKLFEVASDNNANVANVCEYLSKLGLCARDYLTRDFDGTLSGGERKRIELALALSQNAKVYIFDEPEAGIDLWNFDKFLSIFNNLKANSLCIVITHERKILELADKIVVLENGKVKEYSNKEEILKQFDFVCERLKGEKSV